MSIFGIAKKDERTKNLVKRLKPEDIAVIAHSDLDKVSAEALIGCHTKAVINAFSSITGRYKSEGAYLLVKNGIFVLDDIGIENFNEIIDGEKIEIKDNKILRDGTILCEGRILNELDIKEKLKTAEINLSREFENFVKNTLEYLEREKGALFSDLNIPDKISLKRRQVLVVVRGQDYQEDLRALNSYIRETRPVLIGVDGGADALLEFGYKPDLIIGDMDSVSDETLRCGAKILVHAYPDGRAPGLERIKRLGLEPKIISASGMSEDVALLLAYQLGAELIVGVGMHFSLSEFLEKGRKGMASTFLTRLKIGNILFDAKGVSRLYKTRMKFSLLFFLIIAGLVPIFVILFSSPVAKPFIRIIKILIKKNFGV